MLDNNFWKNQTIFITGASGFKAGWIITWLLTMGANVIGYSLNPENGKAIFITNELSKKIEYINGNILDDFKLYTYLIKCKPSIVLHLAAQSLVGNSYKNPIDTFNTNVIGTVNLLDCCRDIQSIKAILIVTSDKCYDNKEYLTGYLEDDALGGYDPYGASKACAEIVTSAYRRAFFSKPETPAVATARAGNVLGGGDWADGRLMTNIVESIVANKLLHVRYPKAIRPWQHVLDVSHGYLVLTEYLVKYGKQYAEAWNFGPNDSNITVEQLINKINLSWNFNCKYDILENSLLETNILKLNSKKANTKLNWSTKLDIDETVNLTTDWYKMVYGDNISMFDFTVEQINNYRNKYDI